MVSIRQWFNENKEGIIGGGVVGTILFFLFLRTNNMNILVDVAKNTSGLFDFLRQLPIFINMPLPQFLLIKVWLGFVAVGMLVGAIIDMLLPERIL